MEHPMLPFALMDGKFPASTQRSVHIDDLLREIQSDVMGYSLGHDQLRQVLAGLSACRG